MHAFWQFIGDWWLLILIFGGGILDWIAERFDVGVGALRRRAREKRKHQLKLKRLELEIARTRAGQAAGGAVAPRPGPCVHRNVKAVIGPFPQEELLGWLCECGTQLPPDWAVRAEDL
jgi:hypothetical protein